MNNKIDRVKLRRYLRKIGEGVEFQIAFRCPKSWKDMTPVTVDVRHCSGCDHNVYDLIGKSQEEVNLVVAENDGKICGRVSIREEDDKVVFGHCEKGEAPAPLLGKISPIKSDRDRRPPYGGPLPHHHSYGSVSGGSADPKLNKNGGRNIT